MFFEISFHFLFNFQDSYIYPHNWVINKSLSFVNQGWTLLDQRRAKASARACEGTQATSARADTSATDTNAKQRHIDIRTYRRKDWKEANQHSRIESQEDGKKERSYRRFYDCPRNAGTWQPSRWYRRTSNQWKTHGTSFRNYRLSALNVFSNFQNPINYYTGGTAVSSLLLTSLYLTGTNEPSGSSVRITRKRRRQKKIISSQIYFGKTKSEEHSIKLHVLISEIFKLYILVHTLYNNKIKKNKNCLELRCFTRKIII